MKLEKPLINAALESNKKFAKELKRVIDEDLKMNISRFSEISNIPSSTLYKIISSEREPNLKTFRKIIITIKKITGEEKEKNFIAVIAARPVLDKLKQTSIEHKGKTVGLEEYAATSMEEVIISSIQAEREGASALVCAPIVSSTIEKIINIPVVTIMPINCLNDAIEIAIKKSNI